jgi:hypothetical protein
MSLAAGTPFPEVVLQDLEGRAAAPAAALGDRLALVVFGHKDCDTTRLTLPYVDRMHRQGAPAFAILQDDAAGVAALQERIGALQLPIFLDQAPYAFATAVAAGVVPLLFLVGADGVIESVAEGFKRAEMEAFAARFGLGAPFFKPGEKAPALRPG